MRVFYILVPETIRYPGDNEDGPEDGDNGGSGKV